jgi:NADPH:quinone reductase-like Zn-dependent oxidoreductase
VIPDFEDKRRHMCSAMIATASAFPGSLTDAQKTVIVIAENSPLQSTTAEEIKSHIETLGSPGCRIVTLQEVAFTEFTGTSCIFLSELGQPFLFDITDENYACLQRIVSSAQDVLWVTSGRHGSDSPTAGMITGFARCIRGEFPKMNFITLALQEVQDISAAVQNIVTVFRNISDKAFETDYVERNGFLGINRVFQADYLNHHVAARTVSQAVKPQSLHSSHSRRLKLSVELPGLLETLQFVEDEVTQSVASDEIEILVKASGLNFRDILIALGQEDASAYLGMECAGIVSQAGQTSGFQTGDRVCAMLEGSLRTYARCKATTAIKIPEDMTFQSAAAIPVLYPTAYYALMHWARMKAGESILIHSGAGGLGQACIQLAKLLDAEIYVTVSSEEKKRLIREVYKIPESHIFSSRTSSFVQGIKNMTQGRGVDIIVNSLAGEALKSSWECIAPFGRFLETGKKDIVSYGQLPMFPFSRNVMFASVDLSYQYHHSKDILQGLLQETMKLIREKKVTLPFPLQPYNASQIEDAFRHMQSGKSMGKIVIEFHDEDEVKVCLALRLMWLHSELICIHILQTVPSMLPTYSFDPDATYIIAGGFGGLGRSIARWMADRKARHIILVSRKGVRSKAAQELLDELQARGVDVASPCCDVSDAQALASALELCSVRMPPIKGCIQGTMVLKVRFLKQCTIGRKCSRLTRIHCSRI